MSKKEFTDQDLILKNKLSDIELIELINKGTMGLHGVEVIKSMLDMRFKKVLNHLKEITEKNIETQEKYNIQLTRLTRALVSLTWAILILTFIMAGVAVITIFK